MSLKVVQRPIPCHYGGSHAKPADLMALLGQSQEGPGKGGHSSRVLDLAS